MDVLAQVLHILLHPSFLPASGEVAELGLEQVVAIKDSNRALTLRSFTLPILSTAVRMLP